MTTPAAAALRAEIVSMLATIIPQIRGLEDLEKVSLSEPTLVFVREDDENISHRRDLCNAVLDALTALEGDGWPEMPKVDLPPSSFQELQEQRSDILAAIDNRFEAQPLASNISAELGNPSDKST